ncbi:MAG: hypothetical protein Q8916_09645, partial [Bacteroidota bacterium]|nr:hypothetical protein [Bacteroidota bacterium]
MAIRNLKPRTAATRYYSISTFEEITSTTPEKSLLNKLSKSGGRGNTGRITSRHRGGGHKRMYRIIDFKTELDGVPNKQAVIDQILSPIWGITFAGGKIELKDLKGFSNDK